MLHVSSDFILRVTSENIHKYAAKYHNIPKSFFITNNLILDLQQEVLKTFPLHYFTVFSWGWRTEGRGTVVDLYLQILELISSQEVKKERSIMQDSEDNWREGSKEQLKGSLLLRIRQLNNNGFCLISAFLSFWREYLVLGWNIFVSLFRSVIAKRDT